MLKKDDIVIFDGVTGAVSVHERDRNPNIAGEVGLTRPDARIDPAVVHLFVDLLTGNVLRYIVDAPCLNSMSFALMYRGRLEHTQLEKVFTVELSLADVRICMEQRQDPRKRPQDMRRLFDPNANGVKILDWIFARLTDMRVAHELTAGKLIWTFTAKPSSYPHSRR